MTTPGALARRPLVAARLLALRGPTASLLACLLVVGLGDGALVAGLPAAAAAAAPAERVAFATGMTSTTEVVGGAVASAVFAVAPLVSAGLLVSNARSAGRSRLVV